MKKEKIISLALFIAISFALYFTSLEGDFVSDDKLVVVQNPIVGGRFIDSFKALSSPYYFNQPHAGLYRPLTIASYNLNRFFSADPYGFHFLNIILNGLNGFLVFYLVSSLAGKKPAYMAATLFLFLPIHSEAVSAIVGRAELLMFLFSSLSLALVLKKKYWTASLMLLLGLLSKETAAGFFLVFLYIWRFREHKTGKQVLYNSFKFAPAILAYGLMRLSVLGKYFIGVDHLMAYNPLRFAPFFDSLWTSFKVFYLYLFKTVAPTQLSSDYSFNQIPIVANPFMSFETLAGVAILAGLIFIAWKKRASIYGLSAAMFLLVFLPVSNWLIKIGTIMGERLMYAPSLGLAILAATAISNFQFPISNKFSKFKILNSQVVSYLLLAMLFSWYGWVIIDRNKDWRTEASIITSGYEASPNSVVSLTNMAFLSFNDKKYTDAISWTDRALKIVPDHLPALFLGGHAYKNIGDLKSAEDNWIKVAQINSNYTPVYLSLGILYYEQGKLEKADTALEKGFVLEKTWGKLFPLVLVKINQGKYDKAIELIRTNFGDNPLRRELKFALGLAYLKKGEMQKAEYYLSQIKDKNIPIDTYFKSVINQKVFKISEY